MWQWSRHGPHMPCNTDAIPPIHVRTMKIASLFLLYLNLGFLVVLLISYQLAQLVISVVVIYSIDIVQPPNSLIILREHRSDSASVSCRGTDVSLWMEQSRRPYALTSIRFNRVSLCLHVVRRWRHVNKELGGYMYWTCEVDERL